MVGRMYPFYNSSSSDLQSTSNSSFNILYNRPYSIASQDLSSYLQRSIRQSIPTLQEASFSASLLQNNRAMLQSSRGSLLLSSSTIRYSFVFRAFLMLSKVTIATIVKLLQSSYSRQLRPSYTYQSTLLQQYYRFLSVVLILLCAFQGFPSIRRKAKPSTTYAQTI